MTILTLLAKCLVCGGQVLSKLFNSHLNLIDETIGKCGNRINENRPSPVTSHSRVIEPLKCQSFHLLHNPQSSFLFILGLLLYYSEESVAVTKKLPQ